MKAFFFRQVEGASDVTKTNEQTVRTSMLFFHVTVYELICDCTTDQRGSGEAQGSQRGEGQDEQRD